MEEKLLDILVSICADNAIRENYNVDLFEEDFLDSLGFVELLLSMEETFGVTISPTEYDKQDLSTINKILNVLKEKGVAE